VVALLVPDRAKLEHEATLRGWATGDYTILLGRPEVRARFEAEIARVNQGRASFEQIKKFDLLERELTQEAGELTPSLKVKRRVVLERYAQRIEAMYGAARVESAA
jgi:long-chain acyl-CoA synthetase